jgi:hypothetical protein
MPVSSFSHTRRRCALFFRGEQGQLRVVMDHRFQVQPAHFGEVARRVRPAQHHDAVAMSRRAQAQAVRDRGHAERIGLRQRARAALQAMAVGVGLDHRHDPGTSAERTDAREIGAQGVEVDGCDCGTRHADYSRRPTYDSGV